MSSLNISLEDFIDSRNDSISLKIYDSTSYSLFAIKKILQTYNNEGFDNVDYFDFSKDKKIEDLIALFNTYPYMSSYRYVIISGINEKDSEIIDKITNYLLNPMKTTKHIFILANNKTDLLTEHTLTEDNSGDAIIKFIKGKINESNTKLSERNINKLANTTSNKLSIISYINKIKLLEESNLATENIIDELLGDQKRESFKETYELINYINDKNLGACLIEIQKTKFKENIFLEISRLTWRFRTYLKIKSLKNASLSKEEIIKATKVSKYQYKYFDNETKRKSVNEILNALRELKKVDALLKTTDLGHENIIFQLFMKLCRN